MKASRAAVKQAKAVTSLEAKVDLILAHLGIAVPSEAPPAEEPAEVAAPVESEAPIEVEGEAAQRSQLEENRERFGTRGSKRK